MAKILEDSKVAWKKQTEGHFEIQAVKYTNLVKRELGIKT